LVRNGFGNINYNIGRSFGMRKLFAMVVIGLGLVVGFGFSNEMSVSACDICEEKTYQEMTDEEFAMHVRDTHIERDLCTEEHTICMECDGYFCDNLTCWCGRETSIDKVMTYEQLMQFEQAIYDMYCDKYCTNYCEECDYYYYAECMCNACYSDCEDCLEYDYQLFIADNYDMIMDIYEDIMNQLEEYRIAKEREETVIEIYEF
jgi:hypothetical protein